MTDRSEQAKQLWTLPEFRQKIIAASVAGKATPESKAKRSESSRQLWEDPEYREKQRIKHEQRKKRYAEERVKITCLTCGKECWVNATVAKTKRFCSRRCVLDHPSFNKDRQFPTQTCEACQSDFQPSGAKQRCCVTCVPTLAAKSRWKAYGLTQPAYEALLQQQGNCCALCERSFVGMPTKEIHVDHDHDAGHVRGILCSQCNRSLGIVECIPNFLKKVTVYVHI